MLQQSITKTLDNSISASPEDRQQIRSPNFTATETEIRTMGSESPDILKAIDRLEEKILNSPRVPLTGKTMVDEEAILELLDAIRLSLPEVVATAQEILQYKHQIIKAAQAQVQQMLTEADRQAERVTNELGIVDRSEQEAIHLRQLAIAECERLRQQTCAEIDQMRDRNMWELEQMRQEITTECQQIQTGADEYADRVLHNMEYQLKEILQSIHLGRQRLNNDADALRSTQPTELEVTSLSDRLSAIGDCHRTPNQRTLPTDSQS